MSEPKISQAALAAADSCCAYCLTRFPCATPPHLMIDRPWFAEKVQKAIDAEVERLRAVNAELLAACRKVAFHLPSASKPWTEILEAVAKAEGRS